MGLRRFDLDLDRCKACNEYLVDLGIAPGCPGCDGQLLRRQLSEPPKPIPQQVQLTRNGAIIWRKEFGSPR
jgi:hypothetical protein